MEHILLGDPIILGIKKETGVEKKEEDRPHMEQHKFTSNRRYYTLLASTCSQAAVLLPAGAFCATLYQLLT